MGRSHRSAEHCVAGNPVTSSQPYLCEAGTVARAKWQASKSIIKCAIAPAPCRLAVRASNHGCTAMLEMTRCLILVPKAEVAARAANP